MFFGVKMSIEDFQLLDDTTIDASIIKELRKIDHQQGDHLKDTDQSFEFIFRDENNYHQIGNANIQYIIAVGKADKTDRIRLVNSVFAKTFKQATMATSGGSEIGINRFVATTFTTLRVLLSMDVDLMLYFEKICEKEAGIGNSLLKQMLVNNHDKVRK